MKRLLNRLFEAFGIKAKSDQQSFRIRCGDSAIYYADYGSLTWPHGCYYYEFTWHILEIQNELYGIAHDRFEDGYKVWVFSSRKVQL